MDKSKRIRTPVDLTEPEREKAAAISDENTGIRNKAQGIRIALKAYKLKRE